MRDSIERNLVLLVGLVIVSILSMLLAYYAGFRTMLQQIAHQPERLRDITFYIWDHYSFARHGWLVFLSIDDFDKNIAYSNHSLAYLMLMYLFYKVEMLLPVLPMRATVAFFNALSLVAVTGYIAVSMTKQRVADHHRILFLLAIAFMLTMPGFWISAGRFNVDNPFPLMFSTLMIAAYFIVSDKYSGPRMWLSVLFFSFLSPIAGVLLGAFLLLWSAREAPELKQQIVKLSLMLILFSAVIYLQPVAVSKLLGFKASNSSWLFRSGLDGDRTYFSNILNSIIFPYFPRPPHLLLVPTFLLLLQILTMVNKSTDGGKSLFSSSIGHPCLFYPVIFSHYVLACLFWPQAIAIHPYLYDYLLLAPICAWAAFNFISAPVLVKHWRLWVLVLLFLISFNLQQIAQAKCAGCYYPTWTGNQIKLQ